MGFKFNPFSGNFDQTGSGGGGSSYIDGEVATYADLPLDGTAALNSAWLVREASGTWLLGRKPAGIYIRTATAGSSRDADYTYAGILPDVFSDANFTLYDESDSTKNAKFQLSGIATGATRTITVPNKNVTLDDAGDSRTPTAHAASHAAGTKAQFSGQVAGMTEDVFIRANTAGTAGNSITLAFDGVDDIDTVLAAWNSANPSNQAALISGDGSQVPDNGEEITLSGGVASGSDPITNARFNSLQINGSEVEFGGSLNPYNLPFKVRSQDASNTQIAQLLGFNGKGAAFYGTGGLSTDGPIVQATEYEVTNNVNFYVNAYGGNVSVGKTTNGAKLDVGGKIRLADTSDQTKQVELSAASVGAGQVRVVTFPDKNITLDDAGDARTPTSHTHGNLTNDGKLGSTAGLPVVTTTAGAVTTLALGTANQVLRVNSGANGVEFADPAASGVTGAAASASDVLGVSGANITGVDATADRIVFWDDSANKLTYLEAGSGLSISGTTLTATASGGSKTYAVFTAEHNQPPSTAFATLDTRNSIAVLDFDAATDENAVFVGIMPEAASLGSGLIVRLHWMATSATSGNVRWGVQFERSNTDLDADSFDTAVEATAATNGTSGIITTTAITVTTIDGITAGDVFRLKVYRNADDVTHDTLSGDAELVACEVRSAA